MTDTSMSDSGFGFIADLSDPYLIRRAADDNPFLLNSERQMYADGLYTTNAKLLTDAYPYLYQSDAGQLALAEIAPTIDPLEAATLGPELYAQHSLAALADGWNAMPETERRAVWGQMTEIQQQALMNQGVEAPKTEDGSWIGDVLDFGAKVTGTVLGGVGKAIQIVPGGSSALSVLSFIGNAPFALYRGIRQLDSWQQWVALGGAVAGVALAGVTGGLSLAATGASLATLTTAGAVGLSAVAGGAAAATAVSGTQYFQAVRDGWDGERAFTNGSQKEAMELLQREELFMLAKDVAYDIEPLELAREFAGVANATDDQVLFGSIQRIALRYADEATPEFQQVANGLYELYKNDIFREAVKVLQDGKISVGRDLARVMQLNPDSTLHRVVSGGVDAFTVFAMDPLLVASPLVRTARFAKYSPFSNPLKAARFSRTGKALEFTSDSMAQWRVSLRYKSAKVAAMDDQVAAAINTNNHLLMPKNMRPIWDDVRNYWQQRGLLGDNMLPKAGETFTAEHLYEWMVDADKMRHLAQGVSTVPGLGFVAIKPMSNTGFWGTIKQNIRDFRDNLINETALATLEKRIADSAVTMGLMLPPNSVNTRLHPELVAIDFDNPVVRQTLGGSAGTLTGKVLSIGNNRVGSSIGTFLDAVSNMAPKRNHISLAGQAAGDDITRFVNAFGMTFNLPPQMRDQWIQALMGQEGLAARNIMIHQFYDAVFTATGFNTTRRGKQIFEEFMQKFDQHYSVGGLDDVAIRSRFEDFYLRRGTLPRSSQAVDIAIPNVRELIRAQRFETLLGEVGGITNAGYMVDTFQNKVWKPSVILRLGFIPRAVGEEGLAWIARGTSGRVLAESGAAKLAKWELRDSIIAKVNMGTPIELLSEAERKALTGFRSPADIQRLERIVSRQIDANPITAAIMKYESWLRQVLDPQRYSGEWATSGRKRFADMVDRQNPVIQSLLVGREHSWRRTALSGLDPHLRTSVRDFVIEHADSVMRVASSGYNTIREDIVTDPAAVAYLEDNGSFVATQRLRDPHAREVYSVGDTEHYALAVHEQAAFVLDDPIIGDVLSSVLPSIAPASVTLDIKDMARAFIVWRELPFSTQQLLLDLMFNRQDRLALHSDLGDDILNADNPVRAVWAESQMIPVDNPLTEVLDSLADNIEGTRWFAMHLHVDAVVQQFKNLPGSESYEWLRPLLRDEFDVNAALRGEISLYTDMDEIKQFVKDELYAQYLNPSVRDQIDSSIRTLTANGQSVANRVSEGARRIYMPDIPSYQHVRTIVDAQLQNGFNTFDELVDNVTDQLMAYSRFPEVQGDFFRYLEDHGRDAVRLAVSAMMRRNLYTAPYGPLPHVGFNDARVAQWVSDVLSGGVRRTASVLPSSGSTMHYIDVPRAKAIVENKTYEGVRNMGVVGDRQMYLLDDVAAGRASVLRGEVLDDGTFGISFEDALDQMFDTMIEHTFQVLGKKSTSRYATTGNVEIFAYDIDGRLQPYLQTENIRPDMQDQLYIMDDANKPVVADLQDRRIFTPVATPGGEPMWALVAPLLMDRLDDLAGTVRKVRKTVKAVDPSSGKLFERGEMMPATYSRAKDVYDVGDGALPEQAIGPKFVTRKLNHWDRILKFGFDRVITPSIDALLRQPLAMHEFVTARLQNMRFLEDFLPSEAVGELIARYSDGLLMHKPDQGSRLRETVREFDNKTFRTVDDALAVAIYDAFKDALWDTAKANDMTLIELIRSYPPSQVSELVFGPNNFFDITPDTVRALDQIERWYNHVNEISSQSAIRNLEPFLDTSESKSMFTQYTKNLLPFWYAEENFIKRWLRSAYNNGLFGVELIRQGQLGYMGLRHAGVIQTDENGQDWIVMPGSAVMMEVMAKIIPGAGDMPVGVMLATTPDSLLPGFSSQAGKPSLSPFGAIPLQWVVELFPEARELQRSIVGDIGIDRSITDQLVPTTIRRAWEAMSGGEDNSARFASAMRAAMQMMEARGEGLPSNATPQQKQEYIDKAREHARIVMWAQAVSGFVSPGATTPIATGERFGTFSWLTGLGVDNPATMVNARYQEYVDLWGYEEGVSRFLADNPFATLMDIVNPLAFTVSQTVTASGTNLPATEEALQWYSDNQNWAEQNPFAAAWLVPRGGVDDWSRFAYQQQMNAELRKRLSPEDLLMAMKYKEGATIYFPMRQQYEDLKLAAANDPVRLSKIEEDEARWATQFLAVHPWFADQLTSPDSRARRERTIQELRYAVNDPFAPASPLADGIRLLIEARDAFVGVNAGITSRGRSAENMAIKRNEQQNFLSWVEGWKLAYPDLVTLYESVIKPDLGSMIG